MLPRPPNTTIEGLPSFIRVSMDGGCLSARDRGRVFVNRDGLTVGNRPPDGFSLMLSGGSFGFSYFLRG
ncbi:hypothetical protein NL676_015466 [Syzygium grande]|nr:hypothetical protein NL676_015466 [Syzygium grande]